jgi:hypothetical protein
MPPPAKQYTSTVSLEVIVTPLDLGEQLMHHVACCDGSRVKRTIKSSQCRRFYEKLRKMIQRFLGVLSQWEDERIYLIGPCMPMARGTSTRVPHKAVRMESMEEIDPEMTTSRPDIESLTLP